MDEKDKQFAKKQTVYQIIASVIASAGTTAIAIGVSFFLLAMTILASIYEVPENQQALTIELADSILGVGLTVLIAGSIILGVGISLLVKATKKSD